MTHLANYVRFLETAYYHPKAIHKLFSFLMLPLSLVYGIGMSIRRGSTRTKKYPIPIISIGNLIVGGSGKTPFVIALASHYSDRDIAIISRGYGRKSLGLVEVSQKGKLLCGVEQSGDEAMLMATSSPHSSVVVSEDRSKAIELAIQNGAKLILLDDGFNRVEIEKFEILLKPKSLPNRYTLPSGPFREFLYNYKYANLIATEGKDFKRVVSYENLYEKMILLTAIANPNRLNPYLPNGVIERIYLKDHAYFSEDAIKEWIDYHCADSIIVTEKDMVKMAGFKLPISLIKLKLQINNEVYQEIDRYLKDFDES